MFQDEPREGLAVAGGGAKDKAVQGGEGARALEEGRERVLCGGADDVEGKGGI